jgi:hypothetical protein
MNEKDKKDFALNICWGVKWTPCQRVGEADPIFLCRSNGKKECGWTAVVNKRRLAE